MSHKWHYYDSSDELCKYTSTCGKFKWNRSYCGRNIMFMHRHTEFKNRVNCIVCLRRLNEMEGISDE